MHLDDFLHPYRRYRGEAKPQNVLFNATLQRFAQQVETIVALETSGKLSPYESYQQIEQRLQAVQKSYRELKQRS
ncbi:MAG: hypothetical protein ACFBSC_04925 [Microcoleaceae cyanobacterium]